MNPNDAKIVKVTNIADFDFTPERGAMFDGKPFYLRAGESMLAPFSIGDHLATALARQIHLVNAPTRNDKELDGKGTDRPLWDEAGVEELKAQILTDAYVEDVVAPKTETEVLLARTEALNGDRTYADKQEVMAELDRRGISYSARDSRAKLEELLK